MKEFYVGTSKTLIVQRDLFTLNVWRQEEQLAKQQFQFGFEQVGFYSGSDKRNLNLQTIGSRPDSPILATLALARMIKKGGEIRCYNPSVSFLIGRQVQDIVQVIIGGSDQTLFDRITSFSLPEGVTTCIEDGGRFTIQAKVVSIRGNS